MAAGWSNHPDPAQAGQDAVGQALTGEAPALVMLFASTAHDLAEVARGIRRRVPQHVPLVGCSTAGEIVGTGSHDASIAVMVFGGGFTVHVACADGLAEDSRRAGEEVATRLMRLQQGETSAHHVLMLLSDGLTGDQQALVTGVYRVTGSAVPLVGGCAGDDLRMQRTFQLLGGPDGDRVTSGSVVGVWLGSDAPFGIGVQHGWTRIGQPLVVSQSAGNRVDSLDDQPALDLYLRLLDAPAQARQDPEAFTRFALNHPLGISSRSQDVVRFVAGADFERRSLTLVAPAPAGGLAWLMGGNASSVLSATDAACRSALAQLGDHKPRGLLAFDCIARREVLGAGTAEEVARIASSGGDVPVIGFYTYGEIARTRGISGFHNQTLVVLAVG
jgi:hypothetical protein